MGFRNLQEKLENVLVSSQFSSFYKNLGPDAACFEAWSEKELGPIRVAEGTMAFMFETSFGLALTKWGQELCGKIDENYKNDWKGIKANFDGLNLGGGTSENMTSGVQDDKKFDKRTLLARGDSQMVLLR